MEETSKPETPKGVDFISSSSSSDDEEMNRLMDLFNEVTKDDKPEESKPKEEEEKESTQENDEIVVEDEYSDDVITPEERAKKEKDLGDQFEALLSDGEINEEKTEEPESSKDVETKQPEKAPVKALGNAYLADKLMAKLTCRPKKEIVLHADFDKKEDAELVVLPPKRSERKMFRQMLVEKANKAIAEENIDSSSDEIMEEGDDEEEEDIKEEAETDEKNEELNEISKAIAEKLDINAEENKELEEEDLEKKIYQQVVDLRLAIDLEEIKKIIKIITGEWRSSTLRNDKAGAEAIDGAFEGDQKQRKELEEKRTMRRQRRQQKIQKIERLTAQSLEDLIQKAIYIKKAQDENATTEDKIRGQVAIMGDNNPNAEILEKLEMDAFIKSKRVKEVQEMRREKLSNRKVMSKPIDLTPHVFSLKATETKKQKSSFSFVPSERTSNPSVRFPEKVVNIPVTKPNKKLLNFISRSNSSAGEDITNKN